MNTYQIQWTDNDTLNDKSEILLAPVKLMAPHIPDRIKLLKVMKADIDQYIIDMENRLKLMEEF